MTNTNWQIFLTDSNYIDLVNILYISPPEAQIEFKEVDGALYVRSNKDNTRYYVATNK